MKPLAIIPARAGSKRLPDKNMERLGDHTLIQHAIIQAYAATGDYNIMVTTDYPVPAATSWETLNLPLHVWHRRPERLCQPDTPMMDVVRDAVQGARDGNAFGNSWDCVVLLQPTSPLRSPEDIQACIQRLEDDGADACISVVRVPVPELFTLGHHGRLRSYTTAEHVTPVKPNGAVFAITRKALDAGKDWWTADVVEGHLMPPERSVDIDTIYDLEEARRLWSMRKP